MNRNRCKYRVFLSAAEPSADSHCAGLISALKGSGRDIEFVGVGGPKMAGAGCELLETTVGRAAMIYNAFRHAVHYWRLIRVIGDYLRSNRPDLVIVCDSPAFNFHVAKAAKKAGIKTLFYVAPQLWAWAPWRIRKLRRYCDKLCCILPFEEEWFSRRGVDATFVGNPLLDDLAGDFAARVKTYENFDPASARVAIMPGSRTAEIDSLWRPMQQIALRLKGKYPWARFTVVAVDEKGVQRLRSSQLADFECEYTIGSVVDTAREADFAVVASGSATLQVAAAGCPMVILYQSSAILWHLVGRWLVTTKYLSLVNILAGRELVPEFMPYFSSIEPIVATVEHLLQGPRELSRLSGELVNLASTLGAGNASQRTARLVLDMLD